MLESTEKGSVRNSIRNCLTVFQNDPLLSGAIAKNLLTERVDIVKPIGYHRIGTATNRDSPLLPHHSIDLTQHDIRHSHVQLDSIHHH